MQKRLRFSRLEKLIEENDLNILNDLTVLILGVGGVGGYVAESLARSGVGNLILVDFDTIDESNINRQIIALDSTIGLKKVDVLENRLKEINSDINIVKVDKFIDSENFTSLFDYKIDFFVDACDTVTTKKCVIKYCLDNNIEFITCMGTGNRFDPSKLEIVDIRKTNNDPLARIIRKFIKDLKTNKKVLVCTSSELPVKTGDRTPGSTAFVPSSAGLLIGSYIVRKFIKK